MTDVEPNKRDVNTVFQSYALFPTMNVEQNVGYALKLRKRPKGEIKEEVKKMLELVQKGEISMEALDRAVERILSVKARLGLFEENVPESVRRVDMEAHRKLALKAAEESIVL